MIRKKKYGESDKGKKKYSERVGSVERERERERERKRERVRTRKRKIERHMWMEFRHRCGKIFFFYFF